MTKSAGKKVPPKGDDCFTDSGGRLKAGVLDERYIEAALEYPFAKNIDLLRYAIDAAELTIVATRQKAYEIHERLRDKIDVEVIKLAQDARRMGLSKIMYLCEKAQSETVQGTMAITLTKELFPNATPVKAKTIDDINGDIKSYIKEIAQDEGKTIEQVITEYLH